MGIVQAFTEQVDIIQRSGIVLTDIEDVKGCAIFIGYGIVLVWFYLYVFTKQIKT